VTLTTTAPRATAYTQPVPYLGGVAVLLAREQFGLRGVTYQRRSDSTLLFVESAAIQLGKQVIGEMAQLPTRANVQEKPLPERKPGRPRSRDLVAGKDLREELYRWTGVDLTAIEGIGVLSAQVVLSECGTDMAAGRRSLPAA
jgi:hypothetical protein